MDHSTLANTENMPDQARSALPRPAAIEDVEDPRIGEKDVLSSRLPGFYELPISERLKVVQAFSGIGDGDARELGNFGVLSPELTEVFIENAVGTFSMPLGIATNFRVNCRDVLVPMAVEETSVLAAASHGAKLARAGGGFTAVASEPIMTGQIQLLLPDGTVGPNLDALLAERKNELLHFANRGHERLVARGGGAKDLDWRHIPAIKSLVLHLYVHAGDAMGANIVNTMCEKLSTVLVGIFPCEVGLRILTNLTDRRVTTATCVVPASALTSREFDGLQVLDRIVMAYEFAAHDVYRAATNNKGIMNGIDPVLIATGNDWRAVEAGAHAYASLSGTYRPLAHWSKNSRDELIGKLELPMAVGTVGGVTKLHPTAQASLKLLGSPNAKELAEIVTCVGLAQNLSALRALASEGIQRGHMSLHKGNLDLLDRLSQERPS